VASESCPLCWNFKIHPVVKDVVQLAVRDIKRTQGHANIDLNIGKVDLPKITIFETFKAENSFNFLLVLYLRVSAVKIHWLLRENCSALLVRDVSTPFQTEGILTGIDPSLNNLR
jgi:hypothetical protein